MDIKHTDPEKHKAFTGARNDLMLENAKKVAVSGMTNLVIRVPVHPDLQRYEERDPRTLPYLPTSFRA